MKSILCLAFISSFALFACTNRPASDIEKAEWLTGTWETRTPEGSLYETWRRSNDSELLGKSYSLSGQDTMIFETMRLLQENDSLYYIPTVSDQNGGLPVRFAATRISGKQLVFENPTHDFPQVITYTGINADSLVAEISGDASGASRKQQFPMKRVGK